MNEDETNAAADQQADETAEQSDQDQAGDEGSGVTGDEGTESKEEGEGNEEGEEAEGDDNSVISKAQFEALKGDPEKLLAEMNRGLTKKFQELASTRKALEPYSDFINSYQTNPREAAMALAEGLGIEVKRPKSEEASKAAVKKIGDQINERVKEALGPEYDDVAERISKAIQGAASLMVEEAIRPLKEGQDALINDSAAREAATALEAFSKRHPDWKKHEAKMTELSAKFKPGDGANEAEYLDHLYYLATKDGKEGDTAKRVAKRMTNSAKKSDTGRSLPNSAVSKSPVGKLPTFGEAAAAARRGERFD